MKIIDDSNWNEEGRKPTWREFKECSYLGESGIFTLEELSKEIDRERELMSEEEKYQRLVHGDPTFFEFIYSDVFRIIKSGQKIEIDDNRHMWRIIEE